MKKADHICRICAGAEGLFHFFPWAFLLAFIDELNSYHPLYEHLKHIPPGAALSYTIMDFPTWFLVTVLIYQVFVVTNIVFVLIGGCEKARRLRLSLLFYCAGGIAASVLFTIACLIAAEEFTPVFLIDAVLLALVFGVIYMIRKE